MSGFELAVHFPEHIKRSWSRSRFKYVLREVDERNQDAEASEKEGLLGLSKARGVLKKDDMDQRASEAGDYSKYKRVRAGQLVSNKMQAWNGMFGISPFEGFTSPDYAIYEFRGSVDESFIEYAIRSPIFAAEFHCRSRGMGTGFLRLNPGEFLATEFYHPDLLTQKRIAAFLDRETARIDELIAKKERLVELLTATQTATPIRVMADGMGVIQYDPTNNRVNFSSLADGWQRVRVKQVAKHMTSGSRGWSDFIQDDGELFLQSGSIDRKMGISFDDSHRVAPQSGAEADRTTVHNGDTLVCITGGRTGAVGFVTGLNERAYINQHVCLIRPSRTIEGRLLAQILFSEIGQLHFQMAQYGLKQGMGFEQVANVAIPLPPREQQASISAAIDSKASKVADAVSEIVASIDRLREYRAALITSAVTGQIDVDTYGKTGATSATLDEIEEEMH